MSDDNDNFDDNVVPFPTFTREGSPLSNKLKSTKQRFLLRLSRCDPQKRSDVWVQFRAALAEIKTTKKG